MIQQLWSDISFFCYFLKKSAVGVSFEVSFRKENDKINCQTCFFFVYLVLDA